MEAFDSSVVEPVGKGPFLKKTKKKMLPDQLCIALQEEHGLLTGF